MRYELTNESLRVKLANDNISWGAHIDWFLRRINLLRVIFPVRIHRLHRFKRYDPPLTSVLFMTLKIWWWGSSNAEALGNVEYPFIANNPMDTLAQSDSTNQGPMYGSNENFHCVIMLNCYDLNKPFLAFNGV